MRTLALIVLLAMVGCANDTLYMPSDADWVKPGADEADRAFAMLDCQSQWSLAFDGLNGTVGLRPYQDEAGFRVCMEEQGWTRR
jgi:hypothetical protein